MTSDPKASPAASATTRSKLWWRVGIGAFVLAVAVGVIALNQAVDYVGPPGLYCSSSDTRNGACAQTWKETTVKAAVLFGAHPSEANVSSGGLLNTARAAFVVAILLLLTPLRRPRRTRPNR